MKLCIMLVGCVLTSLPTAAAAQESVSVEALAWMAGCWASVGGEHGSGEQWTVPSGKTLIGISRTVQDSQAVAYEFLQIRETEAGELEYIARPSGQEEASFLLARMSAGEVVFENASHDFPQRISYRLTAEGNLAARIEGEERGEVRTIDFPMRRIDCESQMPIR